MVYSRRPRRPRSPTLAEVLATPLAARPAEAPPASIDAGPELSPAHQVLLEEVEHMLYLLQYLQARSEALAVWMKDHLVMEPLPPEG